MVPEMCHACGSDRSTKPNLPEFLSTKEKNSFRKPGIEIIKLKLNNYYIKKSIVIFLCRRKTKKHKLNNDS